MQMKKITLLTLMTMVLSGISFGQDLTFKIDNLEDTTVNIIKYLGDKMYYADTAEFKDGSVKFDGSKLETGMYALYLPGQKMLDFVHEGERVDFSIKDKDNMQNTLTVNKSKNNQEFYKYVDFMTNNIRKRAKTDGEIKTASEDRKKVLKEELKALNKKVVDFQKEMAEANKGKFLGDLIRLNIEVEIPDAPRDENGVLIDSNWQYYYFIEHYWDNVNLKNNAIIRTPTFHKKLENYLSRNVLLQVPDTIIKYADKLIDKTIDTGTVFQYIVSHIASTSGKSEFMGMENVYVHMLDKYYCNDGESKAFWMDEEGLKKVCKRANELRPTLIGSVAPRLVLTDSTEKNWIDLYKVDAEYKVLYFWEATCGHCKKATPKLQKLYEEKFKERDIEVYAVGKAMESDFELWKKYIADHNLTFTNVGLTKSIYIEVKKNPYDLLSKRITTIESLNYQTTYDVYSTPRIFVLDKDNKILYKRISIAQLEDILDRLQGMPDAEKLFPIEEEDPEERENAKM